MHSSTQEDPQVNNSPSFPSSFSFTSLSTSCSPLYSLAGASPPFSASSTAPLFYFESLLLCWSCCPQPQLTWWGRPVILCSGLRGKKARVWGGSPESCWRPRQRWLKHMRNQTREQCKDGISKQPVGQHIFFKQSLTKNEKKQLGCATQHVGS